MNLHDTARRPARLPETSPRFSRYTPGAVRRSSTVPPPDRNPDEYSTQEIDENTPAVPTGGEPSVTPLDLARAAEIVRARRGRWDGADADEQPYDPNPARHSIRDSTRCYAFTGTRLAYVSSEEFDKTRWTDITIYRTTAGIYIAHNVGVTTFVHLDTCPDIARYHRKTATLDTIATDEMDPGERTPCGFCLPPGASLDRIAELAAAEPTRVRYERDRHSVVIRHHPEGLINALHTIRHGLRHLGPLAASALQMSSDRDPVLASAWYAVPRESNHR